MTSVVVVRKGGSIAIASDALVTFGETRLPGSYEANEKIIRIGNSFIGMAGSTAHFEVMRRVLMAMNKPRLNSRHEVFDTFLQAHAILKEKFFLNPKEEEDDPSAQVHHAHAATRTSLGATTTKTNLARRDQSSRQHAGISGIAMRNDVPASGSCASA